MRDAFEEEMVKRYGKERASFARNENRYFDSSMEIAWQAFQAGAKYHPSPLAPSPCMDGVNVDQFVEGIMEARGRAGDPINPSHYKHLPAEAIDIIMAAIAKAPSNESAFLQGQVIKYLLRCWSKKGIEDLRKAKWYLDRLVASFDSLVAEINAPLEETPSDKPKRYREPTLADLRDGPIACECRGTQLDEWRPQVLLDILREAGYPYRASCPKNEYKITRWSQCRIEAGE
jgi:hypothetical protein